MAKPARSASAPMRTRSGAWIRRADMINW